jgi:DNA-binding HxlR family transcriptional regulator
MIPVKNFAVRRAQENWQPLVAYILRDGHPQRYSQIQKQIDGISQPALTYTLRQLEANGVIIHTVYGTMPPVVEYELTPKGRHLLERFIMMATIQTQTPYTENDEWTITAEPMG